METILRLQINCLCLAIIAILWLSGDRRRSSRKAVDHRIYAVLLASTGALLALDAAGWTLDGSPGKAGRAAVLAVNALYYGVHTVPSAFFFLYADFQILRDEGRTARMIRPLLAISAAVAIAALASPFTGLLFSVDADNRYSRGPAFAAFAVVQYGLLAASFVVVARNARKVPRRVFLTLLAYPLPMLAGAVAQMLAYGLVLIWPAMTLFLVVSSANIENRRARTDYLTGVANRRSLDEELERRASSARPGEALCGLLIDLDDFKKINDTLGHEAGDRALEDVASILRSSVRIEDMVARMGGDEFVVLADLGDPAGLEDLAGRVEAAVEAHNASMGRPYRLSLAIGRARLDRGDERSPAGFLALLDADMYARKRAKKGA